jgi:hypothetical protein
VYWLESVSGGEEGEVEEGGDGGALAGCRTVGSGGVGGAVAQEEEEVAVEYEGVEEVSMSP